MIALAISVLAYSLIFVTLKLYKVYHVHTVYAITVNYVVACTVGLWQYQGTVQVGELLHAFWFWGAAVLGVLFMVGILLMAQASQVAGVAIASIATKMSLVIPVLFGVLLYGETLSVFQGIGIGLALVAVYLATLKAKTSILKRKDLLLPLLVFLCIGTIDTAMKYIEQRYLTETDVPLFSALIFGFAALFSGTVLGVKARSTPIQGHAKALGGGVALGVVNYFCIFFLIRALQQAPFSSAVLFTLNNVAIVLLTTLLGVCLFKEPLSTKNWMGIALAVLSIVLVTLL